MGWQTKGGGSYYTRSRREGGRVVREYLGGGAPALIIAQMDALDRQLRAAEREERRDERAAEEGAARLTRWYVRAVENVLRAELTAAGYRQHDRGEWRKRRQEATRQADGGGLDMATEVQKAAKAELARREEGRQELARAVGQEAAIREAAVPATQEDRRALIFAAMAGDTKLEARALACVRAFPAETVLGWADPKDACLDLVALSRAAPGRAVMRAVLDQEYCAARERVAGEDPTPLEALLAERITVLRFQITHYERAYEAGLARSMSLPQSDHQLKRLDRLHKQYVRAIESMAKVRRLQLPALLVGQVNIGERQLNVGDRRVNVADGPPAAGGPSAVQE